MMRLGALSLVLAGLLGVTGCGAPENRTERSTTNPSEGLDPGDPRILRWSAPVHYHGVEVRLELPAGAEGQNARIQRDEIGDCLTAADLSIAYRYNRFEVAGRARFHFTPGSRVFVFQPPSREAPWETTMGGRLALVWIGNAASSPVVREDRADGSVTWHLARTSVDWQEGEPLVVRRGDEEERFPLPVTLLLGNAGEVLESRPRVR